MKPSIKNQKAFTLVEMLVVIAIIGILAGLLTSLAPRAARAKKISRVKTELALLTSAIESYHTKMGFYPPDNGHDPTNAHVPPSNLSPLYYELTGTKFIGTDFKTGNGDEKVSQGNVEIYFGRGGFANSQPDNRENFFKQIKAAQHQLYTTNALVPVQLLAVPVEGPNDLPNFDPSAKPINTWRYLSGPNATNNPGRFDLWAEIVVGGKTNIIGNWNQ